MSVSTPAQQVALSLELEIAVDLVATGLRELQQRDGETDRNHLSLLTLASGIERFLKAILCLRYHEKTGHFPPGNSKMFTGRQGHDISRLFDEVVRDCFPAKYLATIAAAKTDYKFLKENPRLRSIIEQLSNFGQSARYYNFDVILGKKPKTDAPDSAWSQLEVAIVMERPDLMAELNNPGPMPRLYEEVARELITVIERLMRALSRLFTIGGLGDLAKRNMTFTTPFLFLMDSDLGTRDYTNYPWKTV